VLGKPAILPGLIANHLFNSFLVKIKKPEKLPRLYVFTDLKKILIEFH